MNNRAEMVATLQIPRHTLDRLEEILAIEDFAKMPDEQASRLAFKHDDCIFMQQVVFDNGMSMEVGVYTGQTNAWTGIQLLDPEGCEIDADETMDTLRGECDWDYAGVHYILKIAEA